MDNEKFLYSLKDSLITDKESQYLAAIKACLPDGYILQPQVNLASTINKNQSSGFQNELFRNIDACIFDKAYKPIVLIEINDSTHNEYRRKKRDKKVADICNDAGIGIISLWTRYGINQNYISKVVNKAILNAPDFVRIPHPNAKTNSNLKSKMRTNGKRRKQGCYIATSIYGSYDCPSVWVLRRFRDFRLAKSIFGRLFIDFYYRISPTMVKWFGNTRLFKMIFKNILDRIVSTLLLKGYTAEPYNDM
ncbi:MAG: DUF2726 domain-containing protein [Ruminococcus sp.]|nr:DUF2726 domain-containing protein [Ruminococcus sp.]